MGRTVPLMFSGHAVPNRVSQTRKTASISESGRPSHASSSISRRRHDLARSARIEESWIHAEMRSADIGISGKGKQRRRSDNSGTPECLA
jgi:hypothetical protein